MSSLQTALLVFLGCLLAAFAGLRVLDHHGVVTIDPASPGMTVSGLSVWCVAACLVAVIALAVACGGRGGPPARPT